MTKKDKKVQKSSKKSELAAKNANFWERNEASDGILLKETIKKYLISS